MTASTTAPARTRLVRRVRRAGLVAMSAGIAYALLGVPLFVLPPQDPLPAHADVVLVLGSATPERVAEARHLLAEGTVDAMLWSVPRTAYEPGTWQSRRFATCARTARLTCFVAEPHTTQGEAEELTRLSRERGWRSAIVVTQSAHLLRAGAIVSRCFPGTLTMRSSGEPPQFGWAYQYAYQTAATVKYWLHPTC